MVEQLDLFGGSKPAPKGRAQTQVEKRAEAARQPYLFSQRELAVPSRYTHLATPGAALVLEREDARTPEEQEADERRANAEAHIGRLTD